MLNRSQVELTNIPSIIIKQRGEHAYKSDVYSNLLFYVYNYYCYTSMYNVQAYFSLYFSVCVCSEMF